MRQTIKGWTLGLKDARGHNFFMGKCKMSGEWCATAYQTPCAQNVYAHLFETADEALDFWRTCAYGPYPGKAAYTPIPLEIELAVEVKGLGFDWNGI